MNDTELPVRVQAALALTELVTSHETGKSASVSRYLHLQTIAFHLVESAVRPEVSKVIQGH